MLNYKTPERLLREGEEGRAILAAQGEPKELTATVEHIADTIHKAGQNRYMRRVQETPVQFLRRVGYIRD